MILLPFHLVEIPASDQVAARFAKTNKHPVYMKPSYIAFICPTHSSYCTNLPARFALGLASSRFKKSCEA